MVSLVEEIKSLYKNTSVQNDTVRKILDKIYINQGVRQWCNLSPALFNNYIDDLLRNWKHKADGGLMLKRNFYFNTLLFAGDQVIIQDSEDKLQKSVYMLNQMSKDYNLEISTDKTKIMAFRGKHLVRSKIETDGSILEQVKRFNYLGCELSLDGELDFDKKINIFQGICGTIRKHLKKPRTDTQMKFYKVVVRPTLLYGIETWVTTKRDMTHLEAAEMRFLRSVKGYTRLDKIRSEVITKELEISGIQDVRLKHKQNWINHLERTDNTRLPKHALNYKPRGTRGH